MTPLWMNYALPLLVIVVVFFVFLMGKAIGRMEARREFLGYLDTYTSQYNQLASPEQAAREG